MIRWLTRILLTIIFLGTNATTASADRIKTLSKRLAKSGNSKVRLSAALSLAKSKELRAMSALTSALAKDRSGTIRRICASSLGQHLQSHGSTKLKKRARKIKRKAISTLKRAAKSDRDSKVRSSAKVALSKIGTQSSSNSSLRGLLVGVAKPKRLSKRLPAKLGSVMQRTIQQVLKEKAPASIKTAMGTRLPSRSALKSSGRKGYAVMPNVSKLSLVRRGKKVLVKCEVKLRLAPWNGKGERWIASKTATVTGRGTVTSGESKLAISESSQQCISAVLAQVTASQVVPFLVQKAR